MTDAGAAPRSDITTSLLDGAFCVIIVWKGADERAWIYPD